ncbi:MAG: branched-chain amino acid ABC transporter permease, partial [Actinomycetota bacterium]
MRKRMRDLKQGRVELRQRRKAWFDRTPWARPVTTVGVILLAGFLESYYTETIYATVIVALVMGVRYVWNRPDVKGWVTPRKKVVYPLVALIGLGIAVILPYLQEWLEVPQWFGQATQGATLSKVALFVLFALGLNVVVGFAGLLDLGYVAFWALGAYTAALLTGAGAYSQGIKAGTVTFEDKPTWEPWMWLILFAALGVAVVAGILLGSPTLRLRGDYLAIVTLGFGEIIRIVANNLDNITGGPRGIRGIPHPEIGGLKWGTLVDVKYYYLLLAFVVLWMIAIYLLDNSRIGRAWVAIREDEVAAAAMGIAVTRMKLTAFAIGACTAGVGGVIYAEQVNFINPPTFDILNSIFILCIVVVGGMGSIAGSVVGAGAIILIPEIFREFEDYRFFAFGVALVVLMIFRPQGILPSKRRKAELRGAVVDEDLFGVQTEGGA